MKILGGMSSHVNFIDDNDVFVGYDLSQACCERAGWFISNKIQDTCPEVTENKGCLGKYYFDTEFFETKSRDETPMAIFKITNGKTVKYLHLFNCHNGYYSHGFEFKDHGETIKTGSI